MGVSTSSYANLALPADVTAQMRPDPSFKEKSHFAFEPLSEEGLSALYDQVQKAGDIVGAAGGWVQISAYGVRLHDLSFVLRVTESESRATAPHQMLTEWGFITGL